MSSDYIFLCGVMWCRYRQEDAGNELMRAAESKIQIERTCASDAPGGLPIPEEEGLFRRSRAREGTASVSWLSRQMPFSVPYGATVCRRSQFIRSSSPKNPI